MLFKLFDGTGDGVDFIGVNLIVADIVQHLKALQLADGSRDLGLHIKLATTYDMAFGLFNQQLRCGQIDHAGALDIEDHGGLPGEFLLIGAELLADDFD